MEPVFNNPWVFDSGATLADVLPDSPHFFVAPAVNLEKMRVPVSRTLLFILDLLFSIDEQHCVKSRGDLAHKCVIFAVILQISVKQLEPLVPKLGFTLLR